MIARVCQHETRKKHGRDRKGNQRWRLGDMRVSLDKAVTVLGMLLEGMSISPDG